MTIKLSIHRYGVLLEVTFFYHTLGVAYCEGWQVYCINHARVAERERALKRKWR